MILIFPQKLCLNHQKNVTDSNNNIIIYALSIANLKMIKN